jgi:phage gp29-like protein
VGSPAPAPKFHVYSPIPSVVWKPEWTKQDIDEALRNHELGSFTGSALLADAMTRDDAFDAVLSARVLGLLGLPRRVEQSHEIEARRARKVSRQIDQAFDEILPRAVLSELLRWGILLGVALAQIVWEPDEDGTAWMPRLQVWHPSFIYYRTDLRRFVALTEQGPVVVEPGDGQWLLYTPYGLDRGWMSGAVRAVSIPWLARAYCWRDWQRWSELYSMGVRKAIAPASANEEDKDRFFNQIARLGAETTVLLEQGLGEENFDLEMVWPNTSGSADGFERLMNKCESRIAIRILGQNLTTEVRSGSLAAARVHENVKLDILQFDDRTLGETLRAHLLRPFCRFNYAGGERLAPRVGWRTAPTEDRKNEAETASSAAKTLLDLLNAGIPVDVRAFAQRFNIPLLAPDNDDEREPAPDRPDQPSETDAPSTPTSSQSQGTSGASHAA